MTDEIAINIAELQAEIDKLSPDEQAKQLLAMRVRQKTQQKKNYDPERQKKYQQRGREKARLLKEKMLNTTGTEANPKTGTAFTNMWEQINFHADIDSDARLEAAGADTAEDTN